MQVMHPKSRKGPSWVDTPESPEATATKPEESKLESKTDLQGPQPVEDEPPEGLSDMEWMRRRMKQLFELQLVRWGNPR